MASSKKKGVLGKGLSALLPSQEEREAALGRQQEGGADLSKSQLYRFEDRHRLLGRVAEIDLSKIRPNPYQPRQEFKDKALDELAASIEQLGIIQPITVRALGEGQFEVISGERRLRAARRASLRRIPAYVREADTEEMLEMALVENVQREELNPIEVAMGYQRLIEEVGLTQEEVAQKVSKGRATVANMLRLLKLPPRVQASLKDGSVTIGHARALINVGDEGTQMDILSAAKDDGLTVREVEARVRAHRQDQAEAGAPPEREAAPASAPAPPAAAPGPDRNALQLEDYRARLRSLFSTQVHIKQRTDGEGRIEIAFYSQDDLERLVELLTERRR